jgi:dnd system-associated protein 4
MVDKFYVDVKAHKLFRDLVNEPHSPFYNKDMKDVFIFAMSLGFCMNKRKPLEKKKDIADIDVFKEHEKTLIMCIASKIEGKIDILVDETKVFRIAEEFANGGIDTLHALIFEKKGEPVKNLDKEIIELTKK